MDSTWNDVTSDDTSVEEPHVEETHVKAEKVEEFHSISKRSKKKVSTPKHYVRKYHHGQIHYHPDSGGWIRVDRYPYQ